MQRHHLTNLLVGKDEQHGITELVLLQHARKLLAGLAHTLAIVAVHHKDQTCWSKRRESQVRGRGVARIPWVFWK